MIHKYKPKPIKVYWISCICIFLLKVVILQGSSKKSRFANFVYKIKMFEACGFFKKERSLFLLCILVIALLCDFKKPKICKTFIDCEPFQRCP